MSEGPGVRQARYQDRRGGCCLSPAVEGGPCSFLASLLPQLRARWLFIRTTGWVGGDLQPPGSLLLPPHLPSVSAGHRAPSHLPGMPPPAPSGLPQPSPCASHAASSQALEHCGRAPCAGPLCLAPSAQKALPRHLHGSSPYPPPHLSGSPGAPHQPFCSQSPGPSDLPHCPVYCRPPRSQLCLLLCCPCSAREMAACNACSLSVCRVNKETLGSPGSPDSTLPGPLTLYPRVR